MFLATFFSKGLTEYNRQRLCLSLVCLNILQIHFATAGFCLGAYISLSVNSKAHLVKGYSLKPIGGTISGCSIALFSLHCLGAKISNDCICQRTRLRWQNKLFFLVLGYIAMSAVILSIIVFCMIQTFQLKGAISYGLMHAMHFYSKNIMTKREFDEIQMDYKCCGSSNYTDWFKIKWIPETDLPPENDKLFSRTQYLHSVPFSCCDPSASVPCFHLLVSVKRGELRYPHHGFFKRGCTQVLLEVLQEMLLATTLLVFLPFFLELMIAIQSRYLQTSLEDSKRWRNPNGIGACWLFRRHSYEPYLQFNDAAEGNIPHSLSSSSEELVIFEPEKKLSRTKTKNNSENCQVKLERRQTKNDENDYDDLKTLLSKTVDKEGGNLNSKTEPQSKYSFEKKEYKQIYDKREAKEKQTTPQILNKNRLNEK